jgi:hypothetical protein
MQVNEKWKVRFRLALIDSRAISSLRHTFTDHLTCARITQRRYQLEASKLRETHEKKIARYEGYLDRLERKAAASSGHFLPKEDEYAPDHIDAYYDQLEYPDSAAKCLSRISARDAGWLALHIRKESERARERVSEDVEKEMMVRLLFCILFQCASYFCHAIHFRLSALPATCAPSACSS